eukprot:Nitzschia sp. Nitz4//scaffold3_size479765//455124//456617//NITZ4_000192-RA/size479765-processed-gene-1.500-mRNA-1//1//CDS//3329551034//7858//frame0
MMMFIGSGILRSVGWSHRPLRHFSSQSGIQKHLESLYPKLSQGSEWTTNTYECSRHGTGESFHPTAAPDVVLRPATEQDVVTVLNFAQEHSIPVVPFGVGTSLEGHVACLQGGISLDMGLFQTIERPSELCSDQDGLPDPIAKVGAGVTRNTLNDALRHEGLHFSVDPGADATIGGMVATGASGTTAVRYGTMRENILELECVLADGTIVKTGTKALKNSAGYDILSLMCGSEGTLGVITSVTVKLHPIPDYVTAAVCTFDSLKQAADAVAMLKLCDVPVLRCELLDSASIAAFNEYSQGSSNRSVQPTLFLEFSALSDAAMAEQVQMASTICQDLGGSDFEYTSSEKERKALWAARHTLYYAAIALRTGAASAMVTDACVPLSKFAELIEATANDVEELGVVGPCFGHAGDGNFHCILSLRDDDPEEYIAKLHEVNHRLIRRTLDAGGTCTGEHGVGYGKAEYLEQQYGPGAVHMMKAIKHSLDPKNILNPGKFVG